jgi:hypothetical protein
MDKLCLECGKSLVGKDYRAKFCSRSCAASHNNRKFPKRVAEARVLCDCGSRKDGEAKICRNCGKKKTLELWASRPLSLALFKGDARVRFSRVRTLARKVLEQTGREKICCLCDFEVSVDVCHVKPISSFSTKDLLGVVNAPSNLEYLCPNHHRMLDRDLMSMVPRAGFEPSSLLGESQVSKPTRRPGHVVPRMRIELTSPA